MLYSKRDETSTTWLTCSESTDDPLGVLFLVVVAFKLENKLSVSLPSGREYKFQRKKIKSFETFPERRANTAMLLERQLDALLCLSSSNTKGRPRCCRSSAHIYSLEADSGFMSVNGFIQTN